MLFGWNFTTLAHEMSGVMAWRYVDVAISPLTMPAALSFVIAFIGERRRLRWVLHASYASFGALSLVSLSALVIPATRDFSGSATWALVHIALVIPSVALALWLLVRHLRTTTVEFEKMRTRLVLAAMAVGAAFASTDLWADLGVDIVRLGNIGTLAAVALLALVALRFRLLEENPAHGTILLVLASAFVAVLAYLAIFRFLATSTVMLVAGTTAVTFVLVLEVRRAVAAVGAQRAQRERLALLGRLSAQMAHDLKTPLTAIKGAAQFL